MIPHGYGKNTQIQKISFIEYVNREKILGENKSGQVLASFSQITLIMQEDTFYFCYGKASSQLNMG